MNDVYSYAAFSIFNMLLLVLVVELLVMKRLHNLADDMIDRVHQVIYCSKNLGTAIVFLMLCLILAILVWLKNPTFEFSIWHVCGLVWLVIDSFLYYRLQKHLDSFISSHRKFLLPDDELKFFRNDIFENIIFSESEETKKSLMNKYKIDDIQIDHFIHENKETCKHALVYKIVSIILMFSFLIPTFVNKSSYGRVFSAVAFIAYLRNAIVYSLTKKYMEINPSEL